MPDYKNGKIYKLWSPERDEIYIGSTTQPLYARKSQHKKNLNCSSKILYEKYTDVRIELLECFPCDNKEELTKKEGEYIRNNNCVNKMIAGRTKKEYNKEYLENNKTKIKEQMKEYRENNKEKFREYDKKWYENNKEKIKERESQKYTCECGRTFRIGDKARHERSLIHSKFVGNGASVPDIP